MKSVQIMMDEETLIGLDADGEVRRHGRSAVLRRIARQYLRDRQRASITSQYRQAYGQGAGLGKEFAGWAEEGAWPNE